MKYVFTDVFDERKHENTARQTPQGNSKSAVRSGLQGDWPPVSGNSSTGFSSFF